MRRLFFEGRKFRSDPPIRIFQNDWLEAFTLTSFRYFFIVWAIILVAAFWYAGAHASSLGQLLEWCVLGFVIWFPVEYIVHRFPFHWNARHPALRRLVYVMHGNHHIQPNHPLRTLLPFSVSVPIAILLFFLADYFLGVAHGSATWAGFLLGYVVYDTIHYACHNWPMKHGVARWIRRHHMLHHYSDEDRNYQISFPLVDYIFQSQFRSKRVRTTTVTIVRKKS